MNSLEHIAFFIIGSALGFLIAWFFAKSKFSKEFLELSKELSSALSKLEQMEDLKKTLENRVQEINSLNTTITELKENQAKLETIIDKERVAVKEKIEMLEDIRGNMVDAYKAISASTLRENNQSFLDLARTTLSKYIEAAKNDFNLRSKEVKDIVIPVRDALDRYDQHVQAMERSREKAYGGLSQQVHSLVETQQILQKETGNLVKALRVPHVRGRWGEITLKRVAELAGMQNRCDFFEQQSVANDNGIMRPDMVVYLPGNRQIVVDAKAPLSAYLEALEAETEEEREILIATHSKHIQSHMHKLAQKAYWKQFSPTPEFVVLFIPGENFFSAALVKNPQLIEESVNKGVILATPTTLITLLKTVSFAWRQENVSENAKAICELGRDLYIRLNSMAKHIDKLGRDIERCTGTYNDVIGSFERRVLTSARRFKDLGISLPGDKDIVRIEPTEKKTRKLETSIIANETLINLICNCRSVLFLFLAGCSVLKIHPSLKDEFAMQRVSSSNYPEFSDDMVCDGLEYGILQSISYLKRFPSSRQFRFGKDSFNAAHMIKSMEHFLNFIQTRPSKDDLNKFIKSDYLVYKSIGGRNGHVLFTGYYEPVLQGSLERSAEYRFPIYARPCDLTSVDLSLFIPHLKNKRIIGRYTGRTVVPYFERDEIECNGVLEGKAEKIAWLKDQVDLFFLQIQGSGRIYFDNGKTINVHYDTTNGRPYRSIGKLLIEEGMIERSEMSMQKIRAYLREHPEEVSSILNFNPSYVFFKIEEDGPLGCIEVKLTPGRSIALDRRIFPLSALAFIQAEKPLINGLGEIHNWISFSRFVLNHDTGGAIRGPGRADLFWGDSSYAEIAAGHMQHNGKLYFLVLKPA